MRIVVIGGMPSPKKALAVMRYAMALPKKRAGWGK